MELTWLQQHLLCLHLNMRPIVHPPAPPKQGVGLLYNLSGLHFYVQLVSIWLLLRKNEESFKITS